MIPAPIHRIGVVIPARNEQKLLPACLAALDRAAGLVPQPVTVVVVLDSCTDDSAAAVARAEFAHVAEIVTVTARLGSVGPARALGMAGLLDRYPVDGLWLATTDADSTVPVEWFCRQLEHRTAGADAVVGTVQIDDWAGHSAAVRQRYLEHYRSRDGHRHMHGANLSMCAATYLAAGGFPLIPTDEDVAMIERLIACGSEIVWAGDLPVVTSARLVGRAPLGFAQHLQLITHNPDHVPVLKLPAGLAPDLGDVRPAVS